MVGLEDEARLYYEKGALVHAKCSHKEGMDVLVEVVDWKEGEFEFRKGVEPPEKTIEMDLHRAMMNALKLRDERKKEAEDSKNEGGDRTGSGDAMLEKWRSGLSSFVGDHDFVIFAAVTNKSGELLAEAGDKPPRLEELTAATTALIHAYPRRGFHRLLLEDDDGTVVLEAFGEDECLLVLAEKKTRIKTVALSVSRTINELV